jgi:hypothetical protein
MREIKESRSGSAAVPGLAVFGLFIVGITGVFCAASGRDAGLSLIAAAISFGVIVYVSFKD